MSNKSSQELICLEPSTAGIDIAKDVIQVCVPSDRDENPNREFKSFTEDLHSIIKWLKECGIKRCIMESTGIYWFQLFNLLDQHGFETILVNPADVKNYTARKSDVADAEWLMIIGSHGLYKPSFHTSWWISDIKQLSRQRDTLVADSARAILHMQKAMDLMNVKLSSVLTDIDGKSGMKIIKAILWGERNPHTLASLADSRCHASPEEIAKALEGTWNRACLLQLKQAMAQYEFLQAQILECDREIEDIIKKNMPKPKKADKSVERVKRQSNPKNQVHFDIEQLAYNAWGVNVISIPGLGEAGTLRLLSELGPNFIDKFPSVSSFCRWCNLAPKDEISGGKVLASHTQKTRASVVGQVFKQGAVTLNRKNCALGIYYRKMRSRGGGKFASTCTAHKMAVIFFTMIKTGKNYEEKLTADSEQKIIEKKIQKLEKDKLRLQNKLAALN